MSSDGPYRAAHEGALVLDPGRGVVVVAGSDRCSFLHALLSNDIARLTPGTGTYAAYLTPQGRMITDMRVIETGSEILLGVERDIAAGLAARLDKLVFSEDVQVRDATAETTVLEVIGPGSIEVIEAATALSAADLEALQIYDNRRTGRGDLVVRESLGSTVVFDIYASSAYADELRSSLTGAHAVSGDFQTREVLRLEAGVPRFGVDMDQDTIPLEAGLESRAISTTKGCYVGQEVIVRVLHRGHGRVARRLVSIAIDGDRVPGHGDVVSAAGHAVGNVTSAVLSPMLRSALALGYVQRDYIDPGTRLSISTGDETLEARVRQVI